MPTDLAVPMAFSAPGSLVERPLRVLLGKLLLLLLATGVLVGLQCTSTTLPSDAQETIAAP